jgi:cysteine desulfurase/selenocysteine lyase
MSQAVRQARAQTETKPFAASGLDRGLAVARTVRDDFPILDQEVHGKPLVYLDSAASAQKPRQVIDAISHYYEHDHANVHRGVHTLSQRATFAYERARGKVKLFLNARDTREIVFVRGTTEAINLVAESYVRANARAGDEILITEMEHHSNIVPWQLLRESTGVKLVVVPVNDRGELIMEEFEKRLSDRTKLVSVVHVSNALGTINPVKGDCRPRARTRCAVLSTAPRRLRTFRSTYRISTATSTRSPATRSTADGHRHPLRESRRAREMRPYHGGGEMISR